MELDNLNMNDSKIGRELIIQQISKWKKIELFMVWLIWVFSCKGSVEWWSGSEEENDYYSDEEEIIGCFGSNIDFKSAKSVNAKTDDNDDMSENFEENWRRAPRKKAKQDDGPLIG